MTEEGSLGRPGPSQRERTEELEERTLAPQAQKARESRGRERPEPPCPIRTDFQRDRDRVLHSKAFRRLTHKTQVFLSPEGDHYRTRISHTLEVSQIARTISRALRLNEDLTEAIALGHDLGHTPFGHAGEAALNDLVPGGFQHFAQSLRVVECLEKDGRGLNLTQEVRDGIVRHSKGKGPILTSDSRILPGTLEGQVVRLSDLIAYVNHDLDDALRARLVAAEDLPAHISSRLGDTTAQRITHIITDLLQTTDLEAEPRILLSDETHRAIHDLRAFLFERVYDNPVVHEPLSKARGILTSLWQRFTQDPDLFYDQVWPDCPEALRGDIERSVADFLASMTDRYALRLWQDQFVPKRWELM